MRDASTCLAECALALAQRFADGATLWCFAPTAPHHAQHVAVEFVHPVSVGARALPAAVLAHAAAVRPGDVVLAVGAAPPAVCGGAMTVWIGSGESPARCDYAFSLGEDPHGLERGDAVVTYHLLWELTHLCLESAPAS